MGQTGWTDNNRSVHLLCLYLFEYQDAFQMNTNIRIIRIIRIMDIRMRTLLSMSSGCLTVRPLCQAGTASSRTDLISFA